MGNSSAGSKILGLIIGLLFILFGIFVLAQPNISVGVLVVILLLGWGVKGVLGFFSAPAGQRNGWPLAGGILSLILGVLLLFDLARLVPLGIVATIFVGIWALIVGILRIFNGGILRRDGFSGTGWLMVSGAFIALLGLLLIIFPMTGSEALTAFAGVLLGIFLLIFGVIVIAESFTDRGY